MLKDHKEEKDSSKNGKEIKRQPEPLTATKNCEDGASKAAR